ncbi:MAG TPA: hypothetical protein VFH70_00740, partial [Acidimicrobiales bacterium]|nr:hypothetical protein [Acidimicrobiales bacterium]
GVRAGIAAEDDRLVALGVKPGPALVTRGCEAEDGREADTPAWATGADALGRAAAIPGWRMTGPGLTAGSGWGLAAGGAVPEATSAMVSDEAVAPGGLTDDDIDDDIDGRAGEALASDIRSDDTRPTTPANAPIR